MNRFYNSKDKNKKSFKLALSSIIFIVLLIVFLFGISSIGNTTLDHQQESLETAIHRSIVQCYAVEGTYPPSLSYLKDHYGLTYDEDLFFVDYQSIGSNMMPDVTIIRKSDNND